MPKRLCSSCKYSEAAIGYEEGEILCRCVWAEKVEDAEVPPWVWGSYTIDSDELGMARACPCYEKL